MAAGEDGGQVRRPEGARLAPAALDGGPTVAREDPRRSFPGRTRRAGEAGPEARRGHRRRRARRSSPLLVELGEVAGQGRVLERPAGEPGVEAAQSAGVRPAGVRGERRRGEAVGGRGRALAGGGNHGPGRGWRTRTSKRLMPGSSGRSSVIQTMRASTSIRPRSPGVFSGIRPMATSAIRNHTWSWSPSGSSSAPNQRLCPLGSRVGSRGVRVRGPPGRVDHRRDALFVGRVARRLTERRHQLAGRRLGGRS